MKTTTRTNFPFTIIAVAFLLIASACTNKSAPEQLVMMLEKNVTTFDPRKSGDSADARMQQLIFNGLTRKNEKFEPVGDLAESFESSADYKTWTFKLRQGVKFHNGKTLTSGDVKYTFETLMAPGFASPKAADFVGNPKAMPSPSPAGSPAPSAAPATSGASTVPLLLLETPDPNTVVFRCVNSMPGLANQILPVGIIPEGSGDKQAKSPVGTGPFKFVSFASDQDVQLTAFDEYFGGKPSVQNIRIKIVPDNSTRDAEFRKGSADLGINLDLEPVTVESLKKAEGVKVIQSDGTNLAHIGINTTDPVLKDVKIRQALAYGIDREALIRDLFLGQAKVASNVLPTNQWAYEPGVTTYNYDPEKAKQLLDEAGKKQTGDQPRFKLTLKTSPLSISKKVAEVMQEQLRRIGVDLAIQSLENQKLTQDITEGNFQLYYRVMVGGNQSTDIFKFAYHSKSMPPNGQNRMRYNNPKVDKLIDDALLAPQDKRKEMYSQIQKTLADELPQIYLWYPSAITVHRARVTGIVQDPSGDWSVVRNVKLNPQQ
ncbi:MAG: ABC transporter substrate-binding protein [Acidobacteria bacterium]|nr:ABC transporter substrate-binding protein [Acidobacteriota bacterium]